MTDQATKTPPPPLAMMQLLFGKQLAYSLSAVAREATGTTWNGLLFFRLIRYAKRTKKGA